MNHVFTILQAVLSLLKHFDTKLTIFNERERKRQRERERERELCSALLLLFSSGEERESLG